MNANPQTAGSAVDAARTVSRIATRYATLPAAAVQSPTTRKADAKELRLIAEAAIQLAKELS